MLVKLGGVVHRRGRGDRRGGLLGILGLDYLDGQERMVYDAREC